ncbi:uncharacterized protein LOC115629359 [Scaptodrosophila lebanonensis]|uniref:Uncharacterized protein LOC115629359 n=1 Tax=Drosophila lebanonensis TaxID=7225 RepID=A0A6J2TYR5_DROLE|nr:uncharacterized protein LOC115629359 [Scaptodrosophila lebanonensis]
MTSKNNIWSGSQLSVVGGALKALAKKVAPQISLNRVGLKRIVAQVIAEQHGLGRVGDYRGHMYYVKPETLDMTELITQAKEALDDVEEGEQERRHFRDQEFRRYIRKTVHKKSPALFKLDAGKHKNLTGVIIDSTHLPEGDETKEILLQVPSVSMRVPLPRSLTYEGQAEGSGNAFRGQRPLSELSAKTEAGMIKRQRMLVKGSQQKRLPVKQPPSKRTLLRQKKLKQKTQAAPPAINPRQSVGMESPPPRLRAGESQQLQSQSQPQPKLQPQAQPKREQQEESVLHNPVPQLPKKKMPESPNNKNHSPVDSGLGVGRTTRKKNKKTLPLLQRKYDKPWLVRRYKRHATTPSRLSAGFGLAQPLKVQKPEGNAVKAKARPLQQLNNVIFPWYTPYQFPGAAGATQMYPTPGKIQPKAKPKHKSNLKNNKPRVPRNNKNPYIGGPISNNANNNSKHQQVVLVPTHASRQRMRRKLLRESLIRDLLREEAIDETDSVYSKVGKGKRSAQPSAKGSPTAKAKAKLLPRLQSELMMEPKPRPSPQATEQPQVRQRLAKPSLTAVTKHARRRRPRGSVSLPVDNSMGSIANLKLLRNSETSQSALTPAKRHLTIAFMDKRPDEGRGPRGYVPWK